MNFIEEFFIEDHALCNGLISFFKKNIQLTEKGSFFDHNKEKIVDTTIKDSLDLGINASLKEKKIIQRYLKELITIAQKYVEIHPSCNYYQRWGLAEDFNIQYYKKGGGYKTFHTERVSSDFPFCNRHLVFMTYLNTVNEGGETEFLNQGIKVKPVKGKTLIWPADWTHTHRGIPSQTEEKYIVTGWFSFV